MMPVKEQVEVWAYSLTSEEPEYLALLRSHECDGFWQPVTGGVEPGEKPSEAARRELMEETGIRPLKLFSLNCDYCFIWKEKRYNEYVFAAEAPTRDVRLSHEHTQYRWADKNEASLMLRWNANRLTLRQLDDLLAMDRIIL